MPKVNIKPDTAPDNPWRDTQFRFDGSWMPDTDGALIGPNNYQTLENLRYKDSGLEGVNGYSKVNTTALATYTNISTGHQLRTNNDQDSYILVHAKNPADDQGRVYVNRSDPGGTGPFEIDLDTGSGTWSYHSGAAQWSASGQVLSGLAAGSDGAYQLNISGPTTTPGLYRIKFTVTNFSAGDDLRWLLGNLFSYTDITVSANGQYEVWVAVSGATTDVVVVQGDTFAGDILIDDIIEFRFDTSGNEYFQDASTGLQGRFSHAPQGNIGYANGEEAMIFAGDEQRIAACFQIDDANGTNPIDVTKGVNNTLQTSGNKFTISAAGKDFLLIMTTRPLQGMKFYVSSPNVSASVLSIKYWNGSTWSSDIIAYDNTASPAGTTLGQTGVVVFDAHTDELVYVKHFEELYLYSYLVEMPAGSADIYHITGDPGFQSIKNVWDGVYRQPIQFQIYDAAATSYYDYTLQVNESSDVNAPIGGQLDGLTSSDYIYVMFEDRASAIRITMLGDLINKAAATQITVGYWNGSTWAALIADDGTEAAANISFGQSGLISWEDPGSTSEKATSRFGSFGYLYRITLGGTLTGTKGGTAEVLVDVCTGVPAISEVLPFDWTAIYGTRLVLGGYSIGDEGNRMDYSVANAPDAFNGFDSSDEGKQSLYFGGVEPIVGATQIYNRFGASVYAMLLVLKKNETFIVVGDTPDEFIIYDVAKTIGCVAPLTIATAEVGLDLGNGLTRNVAIWLSHSGPVMFDGAILAPVPGIRSYFDPNDPKYIDFDLIKDAKGWVDPNYKEYNLLIPSGSASENNIWLVYDLLRRKWFTKSTGQAEFPQAGFEIGEPDTGQRYIYSGINTGYMLHLESGTYWDDGSATGITQKVKTGDFFPSNNIWDETLLRKFKIFIKKLTNTTSTNTLSVTYYTNTEIDPGAGLIWQDSSSSAGIFFDWEDTDGFEWASAVSSTINLNLDVGLQRLIRVIQDLNRKGWAHAFEFSVTTTDVTKGFQPIAWGVQYRVERKDNTSTT